MGATQPMAELELANCWNIFSRHTSVVDPDEPIRTTLTMVAHKGFRHLPVIKRDKSREVLGMVSAQDLINLFSQIAVQSPYSVQIEKILNSGVSTIMSDRPLTIARNQTILDTIALMSKGNVGALPIVTEEQAESRVSSLRIAELLGIITLRDLISMMATFAPFGILIKNYMTNEVAVVKEDDPVDLAIHLMSRKGIRRLPVMDSRNDRIKGMLTNKMILRLIESCLAFKGTAAGIDFALKQPVRSITMSPMPVIDPNEDCGTAAYLIREIGTGGFAVADSRGLLGIITERDLVRRVYKREGISFFSKLFLSNRQTMYA
ncbi:MAG: CBS domain-containing protein [Nitrososphaerota archaeon]|nr:CBS domain-containing protein [Nitrososphaerota archaeon]